MTPDNILRMAREAGLIDFRDADTDEHVQQCLPAWRSFAALVAAAEREECAKVCADPYFGNPGELNHELAAAIRARGKP